MWPLDFPRAEIHVPAVTQDMSRRRFAQKSEKAKGKQRLAIFPAYHSSAKSFDTSDQSDDRTRCHGTNCGSKQTPIIAHSTMSEEQGKEDLTTEGGKEEAPPAPETAVEDRGGEEQPSGGGNQQ